MEPASFAEANAILDPPLEIPQECVESINICRAFLPDGFPAIITCWKPTKEELAEINRTGRVWVMCMGVTQPPMTVRGYPPFLPGE